jgi:hypothetical protein
MPHLLAEHFASRDPAHLKGRLDAMTDFISHRIEKALGPAARSS